MTLLATLACRSPAPTAPALPGAVPGPWGLTVGELGTQRLYRVEVRRGEEDGTLRLALRLAEPARFDLRAADTFGRPLWTLTVDGDAGRWVAVGRGAGCRFDPARPMRVAGLDWGLPARDLAATLTGRLPEAPAASDALRDIDFLDGAGRRWTAMRDGVGPLRWTLWREDAAVLGWERAGRGGVLSARAARLQIRWREVAREPLGGDGPRLEPSAAEEPECDDADLS